MFRCQNNRLKEKINTFAQDLKNKLLGKNNGIKMIAIEYEKKTLCVYKIYYGFTVAYI